MVTALILRKTQPTLQIDLIESDKIGIVGVGEGSTEHWQSFSLHCDIDLSRMIKETDATFKYGINFDNWHGDGTNYFHSVSSSFSMESQTGSKMVFAHLIATGATPKDLIHPHVEPSLHRAPYWSINQFHFNTGNMNDIFGHAFSQGPFGDIFGHMRGQRRNRDLNIQCQVTLLDSYVGKQLEASYRLPSGRTQSVVINLPVGIAHGETIRYAHLGDDSVPGIPPGSLNVTVLVLPDEKYQRVGDDLYTSVEINPIEAMIGCRKTVKMITGKEMTLDIRAGVESGAEFASAGQGFTNTQTQRKGRFVSVVKIKTPQVIDPAIIARLKELNDDISNRS
jgi:hypothetical protein